MTISKHQVKPTMFSRSSPEGQHIDPCACCISPTRSFEISTKRFFVSNRTSTGCIDPSFPYEWETFVGLDVQSKEGQRNVRHVIDERHVPTRFGTRRHVSHRRTYQARLPSTQGACEVHPQEHLDVERGRGEKGRSRAKQCV